jgi:hypothetical protein
MADEWQPMDMAPKDGKLIWLRRADGTKEVGWWSHALNDWSLGPALELVGQAQRLLENPIGWKPYSGA